MKQLTEPGNLLHNTNLKNMKKIFILSSLAAVILFSCAKPELDNPTIEEADYNTVLTAKIPVAKVAIDDTYTKLSWSNGDKISVLTSSGAYREFVYTGADGATSAEFKGTLYGSETVAGWAIYPAHAEHAVVEQTGRPRVYLPNQYDWKEGQVMGPMVAAITDGEASFTHAGGLFAFDVKNLPAGATGFRFTAHDKDITGITTYQHNNTLQALDDADGSYVEMLFDELAEAKDMKFYMPVPTGSYGSFTIYYRQSDGTYKNIKKSNSTNVIEAATVKVFTVAVEGGVWYVTESGSAEADGLSWANATTLSNALSKAQDGDVIYVGAGTYVPDTFISGKVIDADGNVAAEETTATADTQKAFIVDKNVTILGGYPAAGGNIADPKTNVTTLSGNDVCNHVVLVSVAEGTGKVKMSGFTVSGAASTNVKGGWQINGTDLENYTGAMAVVGANTTLSLENMTFTGNNTVNASAIYGTNAKVDIKNCTFTENAASGNGTVWFASGSQLTFSDSEISNNTAANAAGLYLYVEADTEMTANVSNVTIKDNECTAWNSRGALYLRATTEGQVMNVTIDGCTITGNTANTGGGVNILNASGITIKNTEISSNEVVTGTNGVNTSNGSGGGVYVTTATAGTTLANTFDSCTISNNTTASVGAAISLIKSKGISFKNTSIENHTGGNEVGGVIYSVDASAKYESCIFDSNEGSANGIFLVKAQTIETVNIYDSCIWSANKNENAQGVFYAYSKEGEYANNVAILNSLFKSNYSKGRGGAIMSYCTGPTIDIKCVNTTFYDNTSTGQGSAINVYAANANYVSNVDIISCTITANSTLSKYAVYAESTTGATANIYNSLITGNGSNGAYDVGRSDGTLVRKNTWCTKYSYDSAGTQTNLTADAYYDYANMLGALNADGVCPLLLPESNPAVTGGMAPAELSALASDNVPASVLTVDQLGNARTGNAIGAYVGGLPQSQASL